MKLPAKFIYVLTLQSNKYYVGCSNDVDRRFQEHQNGQGSAWTRLYPPPIDIQTQYRVAPERHTGLEEDAQVKSMMLKHGIDHVRGGSYSNVLLTRAQLAELEKAFRHAQSVCFRCGQRDHFAGQCHASNRTMENYREQVLKARRQTCERCGRYNHTADRCYATFNLKGKQIARQKATVSQERASLQPACERCGRKTHTADQCHAIFDVHGSLLAQRISETRAACQRCGRNTHTADQCQAILDINGDLIDRPVTLDELLWVNSIRKSTEENFKHHFWDHPPQ